MDGSTMASIGSAGVALVALWRSFARENNEDQDKRIKEVIELTVGKPIDRLQLDVRRIMKHLDINGED